MPVTFLVIVLGAGLAMAGATLTAQYMGARHAVAWYARESRKKTRIIEQDDIETLATSEKALIEVGERRA